MSTQLSISENELVEVPSPYVEPRLAFSRRRPGSPLIDGKIPFSPPLWRETLSRQAPRTWASSTMTRVFLAT